MMRARMLLAALAMSWLAVTSGRAWVPTGVTVLPDGSNQMELNLAATSPGGSPLDWDSAARDAMAAWNAYMQRAQLVAVSGRGSPTIENGRNEMYFSPTIYGEKFPSGVLAVTDYDQPYGVRIEADIIFNATVSWYIYNGALNATTVDFRRVATHELGHVIGLDHPDEAGQNVSAIMNHTVSSVERPTADDQTGARALYDTVTTVPPIILTAPKAISQKAGTVATFTVVAGGRGPLLYQWNRNGVPIAGATNAMLKFAASQDLAGDYTVTVTGPGGSTTSKSVNANIPKLALPVWSSQPGSATSPVGGTLSLAPSGPSNDNQPLPSTAYQWFKDGVPLPDSPNIPTLKLENIQPSDAGKYLVVASNLSGTVKSSEISVTVTLIDVPRFTAVPKSQDIFPESTFSMQVEAAGAGPVKLQWQKDGVDLPQTSPTLYFDSFKASDAGRYTLTMTSAYGTLVTDPIDLRIQPPSDFVILRHPAATSDYYGGTVSLSVTTSLPATSYRWFKDGEVLPETQPRYSGTRSDTLTVTGLNGDDNGLFVVEVTRNGVTRTSYPALLHAYLEGKFPMFISQPRPHKVSAGQTVRLAPQMQEYPTNGGTPRAITYAYEWLKDGVSLPGATNAELTFVAQPGDAGEYRLRATWTENADGGVIETDPAQVTISPDPGVFIAYPSSIAYGAGINVVTAATAAKAERQAALDAGKIFFYSQGDKTLASTPYESLRAPNGFAVPYDRGLSGTYTLTQGTPGATETSPPFRLDEVARSRPTILRGPQPAAVKLGESVTFDVVSMPLPFGPTYVWRKSGSNTVLSTAAQLTIPSVSKADLGYYNVSVSGDGSPASSGNIKLEIAGYTYPMIAPGPDTARVNFNLDGTLGVEIDRLDVTAQWYYNGVALPGEGSNQLKLTSGKNQPGLYTIAVSDGFTTETRNIQVSDSNNTPPPAPPPLTGAQILYQPASQTVPYGQPATLTVGATGNPLPDRAQWTRNGVPITGATDFSLRLKNVQPSDAGSYAVTVTNSVGSDTSRSATLTVQGTPPAAPPPAPIVPRLINLATRANVGTGGNILIAGFVIEGTEPRKVLVRGVGEELAKFGVTGRLRDPLLKVFDGDGKQVATNDEWDKKDEDFLALDAAARQVGAFPLSGGTRDAALLAELAPGRYTAQVSDFENTTGVALVEIYELNKTPAARLINLSSRAVVGTGGDILIPSLVLDSQGTQATRRLLVRAVGPGLASFGVDGRLADPVMKVFHGQTVVAQNDNWSDGPTPAADLTAAMKAAGAFPLETGSKDAALLLDLPPGDYTIQVSGVGDTTGVALVEVYEIKP